MFYSKENHSQSLFKILFFLIVSATAIIGLYFHEPWFDEAQAWLIGRDASLYDILFVIPHYEGHPPLWHLILKAVSLPGMPYEFSIKIVQFFFFELSLVLIVFFAPFRNSAKVLIASGYFFLYQYCVLSRPYAMLMAAIFICAMLYKNRNNRPFTYVLSLLFMCLCHSYGIALAGGIVLADLIETIKATRSWNIKSYCIRYKRKLLSYSVLFVCAVILLLEIFPAGDAYAVNLEIVNGKFMSFLLTIFLVPAESVLTSFSVNGVSMQCQEYSPFELIISAIASLIIWGLLYILSRNRKKRLAVFLPYLFVSLLMTIYAAPHHFGIFCLYAVYELWTLCSIQKITVNELYNAFHITSVNEKIKKIAASSAFAFVFIINMGWNIYSYTADITKPFDPSRSLADWIVKNNFENKSYLAVWSDDNTNNISGAVFPLNAYFDESIAYNTDKGKTYLTHINASSEEYSNDIEEWKKHPKPDFIMSRDTSIEEVCDILGIENDYRMIYSDYGARVFKDSISGAVVTLYATEEICNTTDMHFNPFIPSAED